MNWKRARILVSVALVQLLMSAGVFALYRVSVTPDPFNILLALVFALISLASAGQVTFVNTALAGRSVERCPGLAIACAAAVPPLQAAMVEASNVMWKWLDELGADSEGSIGFALVVLPIVVPIGVHFIVFRLLASRTVRIRGLRQCLECGYPRVGREDGIRCPECGHLQRTRSAGHRRSATRPRRPVGPSEPAAEDGGNG